MRLRSSSVIGNDFTGSGSMPVTTGSHTMTNKVRLNNALLTPTLYI